MSVVPVVGEEMVTSDFFSDVILTTACFFVPVFGRFVPDLLSLLLNGPADCPGDGCFPFAESGRFVRV